MNKVSISRVRHVEYNYAPSVGIYLSFELLYNIYLPPLY